MNFQEFAQILNQALPDERVFADLRQYLGYYQQGDFYNVAFDFLSSAERKHPNVLIPTNAAFHIIYKLFANDIIGEKRNIYRARVAVGEFGCPDGDLILAEYCFADVSYDVDLEYATTQHLTVDILQSVRTDGRFVIERE